MAVTLKMPEDGDDWLKLAGGVAAGIGTVAALPIFGPIGTVTALGAVLGGLAGAGTQLLDDDGEEEEEEEEEETAEAADEEDDDYDYFGSVSKAPSAINENLFASSKTAKDYDRAVNLLHGVVSWCAIPEQTVSEDDDNYADAVSEDSAFRIHIHSYMKLLIGEGVSPKLRRDSSLNYLFNSITPEEVKTLAETTFAGDVDKDKFLAATTGVLAWLKQELDLPLKDIPPL